MIINENNQFIPALNQEVKTVVLQNRKHTQVTITNYGATITSIKTPDRRGNFAEIVLGFDNVEDYLSEDYRNNCPYFGATIGRCANQISGGKFTLNKEEHHLNCNNGPHHIHGGTTGFHQKVWDMETFKEPKRTGVILKLKSPHMEEGYSGNVEITLTYTLTFDNELVIDYEASTDKPTIINLTNHTYFNLSGMNNSILDHRIILYANRFAPQDREGIPTGELVAVHDSPMDFLTPRHIGDRISDLDAQGYNHYFVINGIEKDMNIGARMIDPSTGRSLELYTTEPGLQFYTGYNLDGSFNREGIRFKKNFGVCLMAQNYPDSPNNNNFSSAVLNPDEKYKRTTVYKFGTTE